MFIAAFGIGGCATGSRSGFVPSSADSRSDGTEISLEVQSKKAERNASSLPAYEVRESAFSDFGMSVKTNFEVKWGGNIEWMVVTDVAADSSAARVGIRTGDRILAIDERLVTAMDRDAMLDSLFQRKKGDPARLLVLGLKQALPRFVTVVASRPAS